MYRDKLLNKEMKLAVVGLGYVGMPIAVEFSKKVDVIGFDINKEKVEEYKKGIDPTNEVGDSIKDCSVYFTSDENDLSEADFFIIAVPTPITFDKMPDLAPVEGATKIVGRNMKKGSIIVYESTVYPGVTEEVCVPLLEKESELKGGIDFKVGYSPERINPGDKLHRLPMIKKIVSGMDEESLEEIADVYEMIITAGIHKASCIKVAEAAKVVENSQRDINIAFMNELSIAFDKMVINTFEVIEAMNTKWNALGFTPGLVGGHCIGVDPYYFIYKAEQLGYHSPIISTGRKINDEMPEFIANTIVKLIIQNRLNLKDIKITVLGMTFKENCPDIRNTKVINIINKLKEYDFDIQVNDYYANKKETKKVYGIDLIDFNNLEKCDVLVLATPHEKYTSLKMDEIKALFKNNSKKILIDIKGKYLGKLNDMEDLTYWSL